MKCFASDIDELAKVAENGYGSDDIRPRQLLAEDNIYSSVLCHALNQRDRVGESEVKDVVN